MHGRFLKAVGAVFGSEPFTASYLAMQRIYVPRGTTLRKLHDDGLLERVNEITYRLCPGVIDRVEE